MEFLGNYFCQSVYHIERQTRQTAAPPAFRALIRRARSLSIVDVLHLFVHAERQRHLPGSDIAQAIKHTPNQWHKKYSSASGTERSNSTPTSSRTCSSATSWA
ncbi:transposase [Akkermansiaceae bacterium]|nr:transposase [Akkermansiaceae bacterium]